MGRSADHVELGRLLCVVAGELHFLGALGDVQAVLVAHFIGNAVGCYSAGSADVENADLAALQEIVGAEVLPAVDPLVDRNLLGGGHAAQGHHAVHVGVHRHNLVGNVQVLDQKLVAQLLGGVALDISLICGITNIHVFVSSLLYVNWEY